MDSSATHAQPPTYGSGWRVVLKLIVIALGLVLGAVLGLFGAFYFDLINITC